MTVTVLSFRDAAPPDAIDTTSRAQGWSRGLSPMVLGPVQINGLTAQNVENAWQFSKVYAEHLASYEAYVAWRAQGYGDARAHRYPMGKGAKPLFSLLGSERLSYVEARKRIYIPLYANAVVGSPAYAELWRRYRTTGAVTLLDFDAYDHRREGLSWRDVIENPRRKMGHAFVLAMMLEGWLPSPLTVGVGW